QIVPALAKYDAPRIVVHTAQEFGPHYDRWPPPSHTAVYGEEGQSDQAILRDFATRAFRRPVTDAQIAPYLRLATTSEEGVRAAIEALLCSPRFLYLLEDEGPLDDYAVASRLSYFLWNTMPDAALLADAKSGRLRLPDVLEKHLERMLADPRSKEFVNAFTWSWLNLQNTVEMAPDPMKFYEYHRNRLDEAMLAETTGFFRTVLDENLPISTFLDADFTLANANLARHYGLPGKVDTTAEFQRVKLGSAQHRGGLLGQGAVLTASANGVDTSPVVRGIWILEHLMGTPPDNPPDEVEVPEPDARGTLTLRELYAKHRTVESCNDCHKDIDPLGFALENFDATGHWRTIYEDSQHRVDPSGRMPNGKTFKNLSGLKAILVNDDRIFSRHLTSRILTYATGRTMAVADRPEIDRIVDELETSGGGLRDLIRHVVKSNIFLTK
ncbi:MAG: DUF1592 domain-containing protein, partial [Verrucomicrobiota bacterium]